MLQKQVERDADGHGIDDGHRYSQYVQPISRDVEFVGYSENRVSVGKRGADAQANIHAGECGNERIDTQPCHRDAIEKPDEQPDQEAGRRPCQSRGDPVGAIGPTTAVIVRALATLIIDTLGPSDRSSPRVSNTIVVRT